ncbi:MAG: purine-nucleoside phosphorylase [Ruminococcaceae bacterium]|nr:purine-nucleoside phosphorylase [Oscillospiraceae bacterium]
MATPHISANAGDFAKTVLMPGDPCRAEMIAKNFLEDAVLVNDVRGVKGYTGYYQGKRVSVMASGMGQPSIGIYSYELYNFFDVETIIRVGSCGSFQKDLRLRDLVIAMGACTNGNYASQYRLPGTFAPIADFELVRRAAEECERIGVNYRVGNIFSSDIFYSDDQSDMDWAKMGVLGVEMESAALYCNAARAGKKALCICTVTDYFPDMSQKLTAEERQNSLTSMIKVALELA